MCTGSRSRMRDYAQRVILFVDPEGNAYSSVTSQLRAGHFEEVLAAAKSASVGGVREGSLSGNKPSICNKGIPYPRTVHITYPTRSDRHVGAFVDLYYDQNDRLQVAEFMVMLLAP